MKCGGNYTDSNGVIVSPEYPEVYPAGMKCTYYISQPKGMCVGIRFIDLEIDCKNMYSTSDSLEIWDGISEDSQLLGKFCGN